MEKANTRIVIGMIVILVGVIALLNNLGVTFITVGYFVNLLWPLLLIAAGINFISNRNAAGYLTGAVLIVCGAMFLVRNLGWFMLDLTWFWRFFWPLLIILFGVNILVRSNRKYGGNIGGNLAIMGAVDKTKDAWDLRSGEYTAIMGGIELDIRKANFVEREISLTLSAIMGGITVIMPQDLALTCTGTSFLGGIEVTGKGSGGIFGTTSWQIGDPVTAARVLHLTCTSIMGGIEIKY